MNIIGIKETTNSNYAITNDSKKVVSKNDGNSNTSKIQESSQDLKTDTFVKSTEKDEAISTYKPLRKKLSTEEVTALKEDQANLKTDLIKKFIRDTINSQNRLLGRSNENETEEIPKQTTDLLTKIFGSVENAYPQLATTPEGATKAIEEGGAYSVNMVADRIMAMAKALAGDVPNKLQQMRESVEKGFSEADLEFSKATENDLPQICKDTYTEVMKRFDELQNSNE
ncbi:hypothetical protein [Clostridium sp.]|uniref:hypothetical protein n=1 Tax=Clostridium sp. TaxID=1506 RepID=UPI001A3983AA|nr:hypothetical protein [Clostridium sp.]MBK5243339.1 hypothetical protein [Clostridium sp.]